MASYTPQTLKDQYTQWIEKYAAQFGVDPNLAKAMILQESANDPKAISDKGASGLTQLMPGTAAEMGVTDINNPEQQIAGGLKYLGLQLKAFGGDTNLALAAYNAGPGAVRRYNGVPPYKETQDYVARITKNYNDISKQASANNFGGDSSAASTSGNDGQSQMLQDLGNSTASAYSNAAQATQDGISQLDALMKGMPNLADAAQTTGNASIDAIQGLSQESKNLVQDTYAKLAAGDAARREILTGLLGRDNYNPSQDTSVAAKTSANLSQIERRLNATIQAEQQMQDATISTNPSMYIQRLLMGNVYSEGRQALAQQSADLTNAGNNTRNTINSNAKLVADATIQDPQLLQSQLDANLKVAEIGAKAIETQGKVASDVAQAQTAQINALAQMMGIKVDLMGKQAGQVEQSNRAAQDAVTAPLDLRAKKASVVAAESNAVIAGLDATQSVKFNEAKTQLADLTTKVQTTQQKAALMDAQVKLANVEKLASQGTLSDIAYYEAMAAASKARQDFGASFISEVSGTAANRAAVEGMDAAEAKRLAPLRNAATHEEWTIKANEYAKVIGAEQAVKDGAAKLGVASPSNTEKLTPDQRNALAAASAGGKLGGNPVVAARVALELGVTNSAKYPGLQSTIAALGQLRFKNPEDDKMTPALALKPEHQALISDKEVASQIEAQFQNVNTNSSVFNGNSNPYGLVPPVADLLAEVKDSGLKQALEKSPPKPEDMVSLDSFAGYIANNSGNSPVTAGRMLADYVHASIQFNNKYKGFELLGLPQQTKLSVDPPGILGAVGYDFDISQPASAARYMASRVNLFAPWGGILK